MHIQVIGKQIDTGDALRQHVEAKLAAGVQKYSENPIDAVVTFTRDAHEFRCDCTAHLSTGMTAKAQGRAADVYASFDQAVERLEKQLRRYKRRLKDHHQRRGPEPEVPAASYVIAPQDETEDSAETGDDPVIVAEMTENIPALSVGDAVMRMEIAGSPVLMFRNSAHGGLNVVYRRSDGAIGWIDPRDEVKAAE